MSTPEIVGLAGNFTRPSKTRGFVASIADEVARRQGLQAATFDIVDLGESFRTANWAAELDEHARDIFRQVSAAKLLVVGSPTYKGSYTGLLKHFFDLLDPTALKGKPLLLLGTGGGPRHGVLGLDTTRGDRLFISLLGSAFIHLAWLGLIGPGLWWALGLSIVYAVAVFRWV